MCMHFIVHHLVFQPPVIFLRSVNFTHLCTHTCIHTYIHRWSTLKHFMFTRFNFILAFCATKRLTRSHLTTGSCWRKRSGNGVSAFGAKWENDGAYYKVSKHLLVIRLGYYFFYIFLASAFYRIDLFLVEIYRDIFVFRRGHPHTHSIVCISLWTLFNECC